MAGPAPRGGHQQAPPGRPTQDPNRRRGTCRITRRRTEPSSSDPGRHTLASGGTRNNECSPGTEPLTEFYRTPLTFVVHHSSPAAVLVATSAAATTSGPAISA